jgi:hypothetical protein
MPQYVQIGIPGTSRYTLVIRTGTNPITAAGGPVPRIGLPLEARLTDTDIEIQVLRLSFDLQLNDVVIGHGEIGPLMHLRTDEHYFSAWATCPYEAMPYIVDPSPPQGRVNLKLGFTGLLRYRHNYSPEDSRAHTLGERGTWHLISTGDLGVNDLDMPIARSDWYEQVIAPLKLSDYLIAPIQLPLNVHAWELAIAHLRSAARALTNGDPPAVFGYCRAALDALPGAKTNIFASMDEGAKRDAIDELTKQIGRYIHSGRHVSADAGGEQAGEFPVSQRDAVFVYNITKLLLSQIAGLLLLA